MELPLKPHIVRIKESSPIELADVSFDFVTPPELFRPVMGGISINDYIVERRTDIPAGFVDQVHTMVPSSRDPMSPLGEYLRYWGAQEDAHADIHEAVLRFQEIEPFTDFDVELPRLIQTIGELTTRFPYLEKVGAGVVSAHATRNEKFTFDHYRVEKKILLGLGETAFVATAIDPVLKQEALHLGWNKQYLKELLSTMSPLQLALTAELDSLLWQVVGAKSKKYRPYLQDALLVLDGDKQAELVEQSQGTQEVVDYIIGEHIPKRSSQKFVAKRILKQIHKARLADAKSRLTNWVS